jgi:hypothetical protein
MLRSRSVSQAGHSSWVSEIRSTRAVAIGLVLLIDWSLIAQDRRPVAPPPAWDRVREEMLVQPLVDDWARRHSVRVSTSVIPTVAAQVAAFRELHCDASPNCRDLQNKSLLGRAIDLYLSEASEPRRNTVTTLLARLEDAIGSSGGTGWPREATNTLLGHFTSLTSNAAEQQLVVQPPSKYYCLGSADIRVNKAPVEPIVRGTPNPNLSDEAAKLVLNIGIRDVSRVCDRTCKRRFQDMIVQAIGAWKGACRRCPMTSAWIVRIEESIFVHDRLFDALQFADREGRDARSVIDSVVSNHMDPRLAGAVIQRDPISPSYMLLTQQSRNRLCATFTPGKESWSVALRGGLCSASPKPLLHISLQTDELPCGRRGTVIACAAVASDVELPARDVTFVDSSGATIFGNGEVRVELGQVLLHEVGHWWGLPHAMGEADSDHRTNIMDSDYNPAGQCLRAGNLRSMEFAIDRDWPSRLKTCEGLTYRRRNLR